MSESESEVVSPCVPREVAVFTQRGQINVQIRSCTTAPLTEEKLSRFHFANAFPTPKFFATSSGEI